MSASDIKEELPVKRRECACGSERCLITYLSKLDRSLLPELRSYRYRRCEACNLKYDIILGGAVPTLETVDSSASLDRGNSMGVEPAHIESPVSRKSSDEIGIAALCDYPASEKVRRDTLSNRLWADEATTSNSGGSESCKDPVYSPDRLKSLATENSGDLGISENNFVLGGDDSSGDSYEVASHTTTRHAPLKSCNASGIRVNLTPFTVTTVDLDTGRTTTTKVEHIEMGTRTKGSKTQPNTPTNADRIPVKASTASVSPLSPQRKVTIRAKFIGCRKVPGYNDGCDASPSASSTKQTPKAAVVSNQPNVAARKTPSRPRAPETHSYKDNYTTATRRSSVSPLTPSKIKQPTFDTAPSWSVDEMLSKSRRANSRIGGSSVAGRSVNRRGSNSFIYMRPRPPWYPKRSDGRGDVYDVPSLDVSSSVSRHRRPAPKGKAKSATKLRTSESSSSLVGSIYNRRMVSPCSSKVERKRVETSEEGEEIPKTTLNRLATGERVYCTFRGVIVPKSRSGGQQSTRRIVEPRDSCREPMTMRSSRRMPASSPARVENMYEEYVNINSDSEGTCYASEMSSNEDCSCECSVASKRGSSNEVCQVITRENGCRSRMAIQPHCGSDRVQQYAQCCEDSTCSPRADSYECDCAYTKPSHGSSRVSSPSVVVHVCEHCADQPDGTVCSAATNASANGYYSPSASPSNPWRRTTPPAPNVVYQYTNSGVVLDNY
ncbi:hypothetical protein, conserved [Babesia ovata]|uniref:Uncharacterized protein n=1 Tax=Babesia ovata TaxID=189622 RepID=A0A2H6K6Z2_9APIC|nr:uncharacterized protein BOVATA_002530 [Babesia ovata]GBE58760.1 hypothetical protein, conserved [Babesia ovata]